MTIEQIHRAVKLKIDKTDSLQYTSFLPEEIDFWLNQAENEFVKTRYTGNNIKRESFEQTQKRIDDLRTLIVESSITTSIGSNKPNSHLATIPSNYWFTLGEEVSLDYVKSNYSLTVNTGVSALTIGKSYKTNSNSVTLSDSTVVPANTPFVATAAGLTGGTVTSLYSDRVGVIETTIDRYRDAIDNPFSQHIFHYNDARPLRLFYGNSVEIITDGNYYCTKYFLRYLKKPRRFSNYTQEVVSGDVENGVKYRVKSPLGTGTVVYNSTIYAVGGTFTGTNVTTFTTTGDGKLVLYSNSDLPEHTHDEIVNMAVSMMIENVGDVQRYQTNSIELNKME